MGTKWHEGRWSVAQGLSWTSASSLSLWTDSEGILGADLQMRLVLSSPGKKVTTSASVKSYQLVKVVSGGRAPGKSSILASPQLLVIERFLRFGAVGLEKVHFFLLRGFFKNIFDHSFKGANAGCCLPAACPLLACCLPAASLVLACYLLLLTCCCLPVAAHLLLTCCSPAACLLLHDIDAHRASHRFGCEKQRTPISLYHPRS